jgi:hypothetical protein
MAPVSFDRCRGGLANRNLSATLKSESLYFPHSPPNAGFWERPPTGPFWRPCSLRQLLQTLYCTQEGKRKVVITAGSQQCGIGDWKIAAESWVA